MRTLNHSFTPEMVEAFSGLSRSFVVGLPEGRLGSRQLIAWTVPTW
jgi:hypothetical protein